MQYTILSQQDLIQISLPEISATDLVRGNVTNRAIGEPDLIVDTIAAFGLFLTEAAKQGQVIADIAKDGIKGIKEWAQILALVPQLVPVLVRFYQNVIKNAEGFYNSIKDITPEQKTKAIEAFKVNFDLTNDKAEEGVEKAIGVLLEVITIIRFLK